jgi:5,10-methylenetetrahydromethanopterin reductase
MTATAPIRPALPDIGAYVLPGRVSDPRPAITQAQEIENLGLGTVWLGERYGTKDLAVVGGALSQAVSRVRIASAISHFAFRHPLALASMAMTLQAMSNGRFTLGVGRSVAPMWKAVGLPAMTNQVLLDFAAMFRTLCHGDRVRYDGPAGRFPSLRLGDMPLLPDLPDLAAPQLLLAAIGPRTVDLAGANFDGVILHPFLTPEAVASAARRARAAAEAAGKDPTALRVVATVVVAPDLPPEIEAAIVGGRAVTYYQIPEFGELLAKVNGFDPQHLVTLRQHPLLANIVGSADNRYTKDQLADVSEMLPSHWLTDGAVSGSAASCADRLRAYRDAGADELILHGATAEMIGPMVDHLRSIRARREEQ